MSTDFRTTARAEPTAPAPLAVLSAVRTPFCKAFTDLRDHSAVELGTTVLNGSLKRSGLVPTDVDEVVFGNVAGPPDAANVARVISLKAGVPQDRPAHTVNRNCGSGMESLIGGWQAISEGRARIVVAGGTESMSNVPLLFRPEAARLWSRLAKAKTIGQRLRVLAAFRPRHFRPLVGIELGLTDPVSGLNMGQTAEVLAEEFSISRSDQDRYAVESHRRAAEAQQSCFLSGEIVSVEERADRLSGNESNDRDTVDKDNGIREGQSMEQLAKLRPIFRRDGSVTAGNSCQVTDGAAAAVLVAADAVGQFDQQPLGYVTHYAVAGCDPRRMGLGPVYATAKLLKQTGLSLDNFDMIELNEAFAAQVIACGRAAESTSFARGELGREQPLGPLVGERTNLHGGAIALGHPVGATGTRLVLTLLRALRQSGQRRGLATLCIGGGQGMALMIETELE